MIEMIVGTQMTVGTQMFVGTQMTVEAQMTVDRRRGCHTMMSVEILYNTQVFSCS